MGISKEELRLVNRRRTLQRAQVLRIVNGCAGPLTAAEIYHLARQEQPNISLATVYRTLKIMQQENLIRSVHLPDGIGRFEKVGLGRHHFQCCRCRRVWTIQHSVSGLSPHLSLGQGFTVEDHDSTFYGYCPSCRS